jgi:hypothetical protein
VLSNNLRRLIVVEADATAADAVPQFAVLAAHTLLLKKESFSLSIDEIFGVVVKPFGRVTPDDIQIPVKP